MFRLRASSPVASETGDRAGDAAIRVTGVRKPAIAAELLAPARTSPPGRRGRRAWKSPINALIENRFPKFLQPKIERYLQRTFGEHADRQGDRCAYCATAGRRRCLRALRAFRSKRRRFTRELHGIFQMFVSE
jgi:hypothetical protein